MAMEEEFESGIHLEAEPPERSWWPWILVVIIVCAVAGGWYWYGTRGVDEQAVENRQASPAPVSKSPQTDVASTDTFILTSEQQSFNEYFTPALLDKQLASPGSAWNLTMFRNLVKTALTAEFLTEMQGMTWEKWESTRKTVLDLARHMLSQPDFLKWLWQQHRDTVVRAAHTSGKEGQVINWLDRALPFFSGALPVGQSRVLSAYYGVDRQLEQELKKSAYDADRIRVLTVELDRHYRDLTAEKLDRDDIYLFEFSRRRLQEGGRDLLLAYAEIIEDFRKALKPGMEEETGD